MSLTGMAADNDRRGDSIAEKMAPKVLEILKSRFLSRKFLAPIFYALLVFANKKWNLGLSEAELTAIAGTVVAFILGETKLDSDRIKAASSVATAAATPTPAPTATVSVTQESK